MNRSLKFLLLTTAVLGCGVIFASSQNANEVIVYQQNSSSAVVPFLSTSLVPNSTPMTAEQANDALALINSKAKDIQTGLARVGKEMSNMQSVAREVDLTNNAVAGFMRVFSSLHQLTISSNEVLDQHLTFLAEHLSLEKMQEARLFLESKSKSLVEKEDYLKKCIDSISSINREALLSNVKATEQSATAIEEAVRALSLSPLRVNRFQSETQHHNELSATQNHGGSSPVVSPGFRDGSAHQDDELEVEDDGEGNKKKLGLPSDSESDDE